MSVVPFTTQPGYQVTDQSSQDSARVILVYTNNITERQSALMKECQDFLRDLAVLVIQAKELETLPKQTRLFVVPQASHDLIKRIRSNFDCARIYLPRAVIEAIGHLRTTLPVRRLVLSMTMNKCRIFLVKSCDIPSIRGRINEMSGIIASSFHDSALNVVITDRADDKYCSRAVKRRIPVVSRDWVDDNYNRANEEDASWFNHDAKTTIKEHLVKPFYGLYFKNLVSDSGTHLKKLITDNQGKLVYGDQKCITHIVVLKEDENNRAIDDCRSLSDKSNQKQPKTVELDFLHMCNEFGYYLTKKEYRDRQQMNSNTIIKTELTTQCSKISEQPLKTIQHSQHSHKTAKHHEHTSSPLSNSSCTRVAYEDQQSMLPPPTIAQPTKHNDNMNDLVLRGLSMFETPQTQLASTQMRRLPEQHLEIEPLLEPSQQLFWSDNFSERG